MKYIIVNYPGRNGAGPVYSYEMTKGLIENGCKVICILSNSIENRYLWQELDVSDIIWLSTYGDNLSFCTNTIKFLFNGIKVLDQISREDIEAVYCPMISPWTSFINQYLGFEKSVVTVHDPTMHFGTNPIIAYFMQRKLKENHKFILLSEALADQFLKKYGIPRSNLAIIPHGRFNYYYKESQISPKGKLKILFLGRICKYKGLESLAQAMRTVQKHDESLELIIAGSGDFKPYRKWFDAVKNVTLINKWLSDDEIAAIYRMNNVITVLPYMDASQSGIIPIAMEYGSPVISTDVGGLPEQLGYGKNGRLVPPGNPAALADAIIELLDNDDMRETIVNNATKALGLLDWKVLSRELIEFIKK